jgi:hypothetical protein
MEISMSLVTLELPDELAERIRLSGEDLPYLLERALTLPARDGSGYSDIREVLEFLARLPTPEETLAYRASDTLQARVRELLEKNRTQGLSPAEEQEWQEYEYVDHLVCTAKAQARIRLNRA